MHDCYLTTRCRIDTIDSPDDEHLVARNMQSIKKKKRKKTIQGVPGGMCETSGVCSLGQTIPI